MTASKTINTVLPKSLQEIASSWLEISTQKLEQSHEIIYFYTC